MASVLDQGPQSVAAQARTRTKVPSALARTPMRSFPGDPIVRGRRPAINAAPANIRANIRANNDRRKIGERR